MGKAAAGRKNRKQPLDRCVRHPPSHALPSCPLRLSAEVQRSEGVLQTTQTLCWCFRQSSSSSACFTVGQAANSCQHITVLCFRLGEVLPDISRTDFLILEPQLAAFPAAVFTGIAKLAMATVTDQKDLTQKRLNCAAWA